ncbi:SNF2-related protein, partial [Enterocloster bolteae]
MGGVDEHPESAGGGNPPDGTYLQLTLNLFPSEQEQVQRIEEAESVKTPSAFSMPQADARPDRAALITQADVDALLIQDWGVPGRKQQIQKWYRDGLTDQELEEPLRSVYNLSPDIVPPRTGGNFTLADGTKGYAYYVAAGVRIENHKNGGWREISYEEMARHIRVLIDTDRYLTPAEREAAEKEEPPAQEAEPDAPAASRSSVPTNPQAAIDEALREWNGDPESKRRVAAHMEAHARDKGTAAFLRAEYGDDLPAFPVTGAATDLPWPKVQRRLAQLMERGAFLEETELPAREVPDLTDQPVTRQGDTITIGTGEATHEIDVTVTDEQWQAIQEAIPEAGPEPRLGPSPSVREIFEHYLPIVKDHVLSDTAYQNACKNSDKENAYLEGAEAVKRAAISIEDANFLRLYYDLTGFHNSLHEQVLDETYPMLAQASGMAEQAQAAPDRDTDAPPYQVGDMVYLDGTAFEIKEIRDWEVQLLDPALSYPIFRAESRENFERLLRQDSRNGAITEFLASDLERINDDLRDVLASGLLTLRDKEYICGWLRSGEGNTRIAQRLSHTFAGRAETMELETGETADYFTSTIGMEVEIQDKYASRLSISWQDAAPVLRTLYQQELDGFSRDPEAFRRFLVEETSDAFEEPFIIRDSQTGEYYGVGGIYQTFPTLEEARQYADGLNHPVLEGVPAYEVGDKVMLPYGDHELSGTVGHVGETAVRIDGTGPYSWDHQVVDREHFEDGLRQDARNAALFTPEEAAQATENFRITDDALGVGGPKTKFRRNVEAIRTLKQIEDEGRAATPAEQETLSQYVGWGGLPDAFDPDKEEWAEEYAELKGLLAPDEYTSARASTLTAHYTSPTIIKAIYEAMGNLGFREGNLLEPSCGVGNFFGLLPENMGKSKMYGVELDSISGRIARQLYPQANITIRSFEKTNFPDDFFDAAIGNVPFGGYKLVDSRYDKQNLLIHEYFLAKSIDKVRPGGVLAFITSNGISGGTMDKKDRHVREYLAERCDLLGAVRLPNNAFLANAGTDTTTDILFLQKLDTPRQLGVDLPLWVQTDTLLEQDHTNDKGETRHNFVTVNRYFQEHPEMVLGELKIVSGPFGPQLTCEPVPDASLAEQLHEAISHIKGRITEAELPDLGEGEEIDASIPADPNVKNYSYTIVEGEVYYRENSRMVKPDLNATARERVKGMVELRECVQDLIFYQMDNYPDEAIIRQQAKLNGLYDAFTSKYGLINSKGNALAFADDSSYYLLCSLEVLDEDGRLERKADMFSKRTIRPHQAVTSVDTASEALAVSISEKARVDMPYMAKLSGKTEEELAGELQGVIFRLPEPVDSDGNPRHVTADEYLSGNIREKLLRARQAADKIPEYFRANVEALEQALPKDLEASEIDVRLGATWVDKKYIQQFMYETFQTPGYLKNRIHVNFTDFTAEWNITEKNSIPWSDVAAFTTYGTERASAYRILEDSLNLRDVRIYDTVQDPDGKEKRVLNKDATTLAQQKQQAIKDAFRDWIWKDPDRRQALVRKYNDLYNSTRPREYDGQHIIFGGINPEIKLREHQLNAIAHILYGDNVLLAHEVGAGKTFEMVAAAMESKRLGLCQKSLFAVPNHLIEQWASEFLRLYPSANILVTRKKDFEGPNRKKFCAKIATGDYDAVIMGHSQFERLPMSFERRERLLQEQIWEIEEGLEELKNSHAEKFSVKQLERTKRSLEARLEKLHDGTRKDDVVTFEQLGVDRLFIDEAHSYKNLFLYTKMRNVAGLSTSDAQKSSDMLLKCRYMDEVTGGKGVVFATGTPVSNSMTELYTMQRYLQHDLISRQGLAHFDNWASTFGETVTAIELAPEGKYRARTRFARFFNLPELMNMFKETADIKTADQLNLPVPEVEFHNEVAQPTEHQQMLVQELSERAAEVHAGHVDPRTDNMLKITSDGRKLGLDQRLINPMLPDDPQSKVNLCVDNIVRIWQEGQPEKLTQLLFCDLSTPKGKTAAKQEKAARTAGDKTAGGTELHALDNLLDVKPDPPFSIYEDIRDKLIARGIPASQIAFIHDADTDARKKELFSKVRSGQVRVLMGSTQKMGAGMNVQDRLVALHDLDCPWRPGDVGRILRTFKIKKNVEVT